MDNGQIDKNEQSDYPKLLEDDQSRSPDQTPEQKEEFYDKNAIIAIITAMVSVIFWTIYIGVTSKNRGTGYSAGAIDGLIITSYEIVIGIPTTFISLSRGYWALKGKLKWLAAISLLIKILTIIFVIWLFFKPFDSWPSF
ncbi:hypothetical protein IKF84_02630 [Candidatus Saccharibacteria bacterium]|nr:hypothetical protein [Candidatus Saccharibacteria bacterium]